MKLQQAYSNTRFRDITYKWDPLDASAVEEIKKTATQHLPEMNGTGACFAMQAPDSGSCIDTLETGTEDELEGDDEDYDQEDDEEPDSPPPLNLDDCDEANRRAQAIKDAVAQALYADEHDGDGEGESFLGALTRGRRSTRRAA